MSGSVEKLIVFNQRFQDLISEFCNICYSTCMKHSYAIVLSRGLTDTAVMCMEGFNWVNESL